MNTVYKQRSQHKDEPDRKEDHQERKRVKHAGHLSAPPRAMCQGSRRPWRRLREEINDKILTSSFLIRQSRGFSVPPDTNLIQQGH